MSDERPHSAEYFGDSRDFWWNPDFMGLMARRLDFGSVRRVLDVGCGVGHWSRVLLPHLPADAQITGVDREPKWVERATELAAQRGFGGRCEYLQGTGEHLPVPDTSFNLATCQTLLIHVPEPKQVLTEMLRALRPGGLLLTAEPNNVANTLFGDSTTFDEPPEETLARIRVNMTCERGKTALGLGNNSVGDQVPGFFAELGVESIQVHISDKTALILPPYSTPEQRANVREHLDRTHREVFLWDRDESHRYFIAGGGTEGEFDEAWKAAGVRAHVVAEQMRAGKYFSAGGQVSYLISGRKRR